MQNEKIDDELEVFGKIYLHFLNDALFSLQYSWYLKKGPRPLNSLEQEELIKKLISSGAAEDRVREHQMQRQELPIVQAQWKITELIDSLNEEQKALLPVAVKYFIGEVLYYLLCSLQFGDDTYGNYVFELKMLNRDSGEITKITGFEGDKMGEDYRQLEMIFHDWMIKYATAQNDTV